MGKKNIKDKIVIRGKDLVINSAGKQGRHLDIVKTGCGVHESKKRKMQKRKGKYAQRLKKELKGYSWDAVILLQEILKPIIFLGKYNRLNQNQLVKRTT